MISCDASIPARAAIRQGVAKSPLTLVHKKSPEIVIARWFKDPKFSVSYPSGPLIRLTTEEFRSKGLVLIRGFCEEYERVRMDELDAVPMFDQQDVHKVLKNYIPVSLFRDHVGQLTVAPLRFRKYDLGGLVSLGPETFRKLSWDCSEKVFLDAFDAVLEEAG